MRSFQDSYLITEIYCYAYETLKNYLICSFEYSKYIKNTKLCQKYFIGL